MTISVCQCRKSFEQVKVWQVTCFNCGKVFATGDNSIDFFGTCKEAKEIITDMLEDWQIKGNKAYCSDCRRIT